MATTWVVVAHRAGARILEYPGPGKALRRVTALDHPDGRRKDGDFESDGPGSVSAQGNDAHHTLAAGPGPHDRAAGEFARRIGATLTSARNRGDFRELVLVAEPRFLGMVRERLDAPTAQMIRGTVGKDLARVADRELAPHLEEVLAV